MFQEIRLIVNSTSLLCISIERRDDCTYDISMLLSIKLYYYILFSTLGIFKKIEMNEIDCLRVTIQYFLYLEKRLFVISQGSA